MNDNFLKRIDSAALTLRLLEATGKIDGKDGKDKDQGWENL